jgi:hypothetical protein
MPPEIYRDGPYILGNTVRYLLDDGEIFDHVLDREAPLNVYVPNDDHDRFSLFLKPSIGPVPDIFDEPDRLIALADIEGNFDGLISFLRNNAVIDDNFDWNFGTGHLVINGDLVDRGAFPMAILWLIYKLEKQAEEAGGRVHVVLGNHDLMNIQGWFDYAHTDYQKAVRAVTGMFETGHAFRFLYSDRHEIGRWLRSKPAVIKIGSLLFVHAGLSHELLPYRLGIPEINRIVRQNLDQDFYFSSTRDPVIDVVMGKKGPIWYRNLVREHDGLPKASQEQLDQVLDYYQAEKMIIGHTVVPDIATDYMGKLIKIDILHGQIKNSGLTKGVLVENKKILKIDDLGRTREL